jgi:hypothetical protein
MRRKNGHEKHEKARKGRRVGVGAGVGVRSGSYSYSLLLFLWLFVFFVAIRPEDRR